MTERRIIRGWIARSLFMPGVIALGLGLCGCPIQFQRISMNQTIKPADVSFIKPGQTTFWDVVNKLGPPDQITVSSDAAGGLPEFFEKIGESSDPGSGGSGAGRGGRFGGGRTGGNLIQGLARPAKPRANEIGAVARYRFLDLKRFEANITWFLRFIVPAASAPGVPSNSSFGTTGFGTDEFQVAFDKDWVVRYTAFARDAQASSFKVSPFDFQEPEPGQLQMIAF